MTAKFVVLLLLLCLFNAVYYHNDRRNKHELKSSNEI
jgi:hypothetical protein